MYRYPLSVGEHDRVRTVTPFGRCVSCATRPSASTSRTQESIWQCRRLLRRLSTAQPQKPPRLVVVLVAKGLRRTIDFVTSTVVAVPVLLSRFARAICASCHLFLCGSWTDDTRPQKTRRRISSSSVTITKPRVTTIGAGRVMALHRLEIFCSCAVVIQLRGPSAPVQTRVDAEDSAKPEDLPRTPVSFPVIPRRGLHVQSHRISS